MNVCTRHLCSSRARLHTAFTAGGRGAGGLEGVTERAEGGGWGEGSGLRPKRTSAQMRVLRVAGVDDNGMGKKGKLRSNSPQCASRHSRN